MSAIKHVFTDIDKNGDNKISKPELLNHMKKTLSIKE